MEHSAQSAVVFGGCGFLGRRLVEFLQARGTYDKVFVFDKVCVSVEILRSGLDPAPSIVRITGGRKCEVKYQEGDLFDKRSVLDFLISVDKQSSSVQIFHVASPDPFVPDQQTLYNVNVSGTRGVYEAALHINAEVVVYCSTCSVVSANYNLLGVTEDSEGNPNQRDYYSETKFQAELIMHEYASSIKTLALRPHMIFGPNDNGVMRGFLNAMEKGSSRCIIGDGSNLVSPTFVDNVAWAHVIAAEKLVADPSVGGKAYNITNDQDVCFWSFMSYFCGEFGFDRPRLKVPYLLAHTAAKMAKFCGGFVKTDLCERKIELAGLHHTYSCRAAKEKLGYQPIVRLMTGMQQTCDFMRKTNPVVQKRFNESRVKTKALKRHGGTASDSVPRDLRLIFASWFTFYLAIVSALYFGGRGMHLLTQTFLYPELNMPMTATLPFIYGTLVLSIVALVLYVFASQSMIFGTGTNVPLVGDMLQILNGPTAICQKLASRNFDFYSLTFAGKPVVFVTGREAQEFFFKATDDEISLKEVYKVSTALFGKKVLYDVDADTRQQQFHHLSRGLSERNMRTYVPHFLKECEDFFGNWKSEGMCSDLSDALAELITFTAARCLLGKEIRESFYTECKKLLCAMDDGITPISLGFPYFPMPAHWRRDKARMALKDIFKKVIDKRRSNERPTIVGEDEDADMLHHLMQAGYNNGEKFSTDEITGFLLALMFGGQHTSSVTASWVMINLLCRTEPQYIKLIFDEQRRMQANGGITYDNITNETEYLGAVITESLRISNPLAVLLRYVTKRRFFKGHSFGPGTILGICSNEAGVNPDIFEDPEEFRPSRWIDCSWDDWRQQYKFVAFGAGRHTCMGRRFAFCQIKTIVSYMLQNFVFETTGDPIPQKNYKAMIVGPDRPFKVRYKRVSNMDGIEKAWNL